MLKALSRKNMPQVAERKYEDKMAGFTNNENKQELTNCGHKLSFISESEYKIPFKALF